MTIKEKIEELKLNFAFPSQSIYIEKLIAKFMFKFDKIKFAYRLGYVGLPLALEFSKKFEVVGFDLSKSRVNF